MISDQMLLERLANVRERAEGLLPSLGPIPDCVYRTRALTGDDVPVRALPDPGQTWEAARVACCQAIAALRTLEETLAGHMREGGGRGSSDERGRG